MEKNPNREYTSDEAVEWPLGVTMPEPLEAKIARMVRTSVSQAAAAAGSESFEEADDFDVPDSEEMPGSVHELDDDQESERGRLEALRKIPKEFRDRFSKFHDERAKRAAEAAAAQKHSATLRDTVLSDTGPDLKGKKGVQNGPE